ncbi:hypothetical protein B0A48_14612 [Cryoendolithus antarcticus]|uniref:PNPLA domain-containing protein n=1 Tax=Cryoendolithus antarcticus TaxID=1507870 RepID=A0A1V8SL24_9PEZI|nr:hypothetical protein B0A48_14612 [Cryoendolithus antarcticus]
MEDPSRLRRKDTTKGPPLRILSLDGGGVRGYSMFIILQELMHRMFVEIEGRAPRRNEIPRPADYFDLIVGTGTGGLIAIMLGRLRLDIDTCKDVYVRMTRRVFESDKTIGGIPYKSTLFKASKLEEAIRDCVREHTVYEDEGNDTLANATPMQPDTPTSAFGASSTGIPSRSLSQSSRYSQVGMSPVVPTRHFGAARWGNPNALLYDTREHRTKTAVASQLKGTRAAGPPIMLRSYDSRKEPAPDVNCTIWQAGRATSAIGLAFKSIQIGQSVYHDDGSGKFNPAPFALDEAVINEWPGRDVGVFVSIGTGKRPANNQAQQHEWFESFIGGSMGEFAEARRRLAQKIEGCEETHEYMVREHLTRRQVNPENYIRLNVEVGVGEFGMNEWNRLSDISMSTRTYLGRPEVQSMVYNASVRLAKIHFAKVRQERAEVRRNLDGPGSLTSTRHSWQNSWDRPQSSGPPVPPPANPMAIELPGSEPYASPTGGRGPGQPYEHRPSIADQKYSIISSDEYPEVVTTPTQSQHNTSSPHNPASPYTTPAYAPARPSIGQEPSPRTSDEYRGEYWRAEPPPLPPKTPLQEIGPGQGYGQHGPRTFVGMDLGSLRQALPYPDTEGPPPVVNMRSKPTVSR